MGVTTLGPTPVGRTGINCSAIQGCQIQAGTGWRDDCICVWLSLFKFMAVIQKTEQYCSAYFISPIDLNREGCAHPVDMLYLSEIGNIPFIGRDLAVGH